MTARPFTARQALQNAAFLEALSRGGNARLAARDLGVHRGTYFKRRARHPAFAAQWDEALKTAQVHLNPPRNGEGERACEQAPGELATAQPATPNGGGGPEPHPRAPLRTRGGELTLTRLKSGRVQLRRAAPGRMTEAARQAFLTALAASANVRLSAAAAGFAHSSFYARARRARAFAREMRLALAEGYSRVEAAALVAALPESGHKPAGAAATTICRRSRG